MYVESFVQKYIYGSGLFIYLFKCPLDIGIFVAGTGRGTDHTNAILRLKWTPTKKEM